MCAAEKGNYRNVLEMLKSGKIHDGDKLKNILQRKSDQSDRSHPILDPLLLRYIKLIEYIDRIMRAGHLSSSIGRSRMHGHILQSDIRQRRMLLSTGGMDCRNTLRKSVRIRFHKVVLSPRKQ